NATIYSYYGFSGDVQVRMATEIPAKTLISSNHSYHDGLGVQCGLTGTSVSYSLRARNTDINLNNFPYHLHCHSSGNAQTSCSGGWGTITGTGKAAKNNVVVAATTSLESMTSYSSFGPIHDGRIKPEISAMGDNVFSTYTPLNTYGTISGTSMSTPGITGTLALLAQRYKQLNGDVLPPSALIKNIACNTAKDLGNPGPDYKFGFGMINALSAVRILEENRYALNTIATGGTNDINISIPAGAARLRVMLTWNDPAAAANAALALVNNLDLTVINGATTSLPWILDPNNPATNATKAVDNISNIEQVTINNPPAGTYTLRVAGIAIPTGPTQSYALTWDIEQPFIEVTYPNGGESLSPGSSHVISWNNAGITSNQTVEYSLNNGGTWTTLSSSVAAATTRLSWSVPSANTSTALVRVSSGSITDVSDATFKILGTPTGFSGSGVSCNAGEVIFNWTTVANATHYDIYRLEATTGEFVSLASNIGGAPYTATGLTPNTSMWFTIRAKNATSFSESERANAINVTVSNGGGGLGIVGTISGQNIICGTPSGVPYSVAAVSGATSYIWNAPPGATIASGQGTTNVTINYTIGSSNGNVSVSASNGTCQTTPSTLPITIGSASITAPSSGGDQSQTVCPGSSLPTLTATATVPAGHTVVWYNASSGGTVVGSPVLSSAGTITYYASSRNTTSGCESITRTPVTLTITQVAAAAITAGGPVSFCQGGSVTLTANAGSSYLWSNGATSQSVTVNSTNSYTVTVTTGSCVSTSPATNVTVNPIPAAIITPSGATTFCEGLNVVLTASAGSSWLWNNGATTQSITVSNSGSFSVAVTNASNCNATSATTSVTVNPNPAAAITAGGPTTFCQGGNVTLTANAGSSYLWSNGSTSQSITSSTLGVTNYTVQVTQTGGCVSNSPATTVTVNALPTATISPNGATTFCEPNNVVLSSSAGSAWLWSNGATTQSITISTPAASGAYTVRVTNANGCSSVSSATNVTVNTRPVITLSASPYTKLFPGLSTTLTANVSPAGNYTYNWYRNTSLVTGANSTTLPVTLSNLGSYYVSVLTAAGCSNNSNTVEIGDSATAKLYIMPNPNNGQFDISYYSATNNTFTLVISDSRGAIVYKKAYNISTPYQRLSVDISRASTGVYNIALIDKSGKRITSGKVMIKH
ncbi:MAG: S8 family serine peptidase, partial [Chitinophagaceae bacterium]